MKMTCTFRTLVLTYVPVTLIVSRIALCNAAASIETSKSCFEQGESVEISFINEDEESSDWIGIFDEEESDDDLTNWLRWTRTCGDRSCNRSEQSGTVRMGSTLSPGQYKAVLARDGDPPYDGYAFSDSFEISNSCNTDDDNTDDNTDDADANSLEDISLALEAARGDIEAIINDNRDLPAKFLRLLFHDCVGGCDGCVDLDAAGNFGLAIAVESLDPIVEAHANPEIGLSRADIWIFATLVAMEMSQVTTAVPFSMDWFGRVDCENTGRACIGPEGETVECSATKGSARVFPGMHQTTASLFGFFEDEFGFDQRETVAIMGAHSLGRLHRDNTGIDGENGWAKNSRVLDNDYYEALIGGDSPNDDIDVLVNDAPTWERALEQSDGRFPDRRIWVRSPDDEKFVMLNADVAIVRDLNPDNFDRNLGRASCTFTDSTSEPAVPVCPHAQGAIRIAAEFKNDNFLWVTEFSDVLDRMGTNGYTRRRCSDAICRLES